MASLTLPRDGTGLARLVLQGDRRAVPRAITLAETGGPEARALVAALYPRTGRAHVVGITGAPGTGKSTLVDRVIERERKAGRRVGVVAVDPSSPFTGGALLGDRLRMSARQTDPGVFIRSMATRGHLGGLARASADAARILDAAGYDLVLVETVGVGQSEVDVVRLADTVLVVTVPGMGDEVQNIKAGLMEIGDVFVVNKADREGAEKTMAELSAWLEHSPEAAWAPPVVRAVAATGEGVADACDAIRRHREAIAKAGGQDARRRQQARHEVVEALRERVVEGATRDRARFEAAVERVARREIDPYAAADGLT
ncbi:MAG TPA: methylmalonyl Co-A mutase-associated GTPase MeaB [Candidatus Thermoplasmatota archaeon]|nr:methylmalonyl Co-A mutase-associated GTPase MeaB [Candidatus Thermoplasmatota archaeon]